MPMSFSQSSRHFYPKSCRIFTHVWRAATFLGIGFLAIAAYMLKQKTTDMKVSSTLGGLAGAAALTLVNQGAKEISQEAGRVDLLGQNALAKFMKGNDVLSKTALQFFPMAGDFISNSLFYGMARGSSPSNTFLRGALLGLGAGVGAIALPGALGVESKLEMKVKSTNAKAMTVAWYVVGGLVAAAVINLLDNYKQADPDELASTAANKGKKIAKDLVKQVAKTF